MYLTISSESPEVKEKVQKDIVISYGLPKHLQSFVNSLTDLQMRILRELFYWATRSTVGCSENGFVGFETTYSWLAYKVGCHCKTVQKLIEKLRDAGLLETRSYIKKPNIYRFIQFLKKKWVRNRLYQLLNPIVFVSTCLLTSATRTANRKEYPHININMYKYKKEIKEIAKFARIKKGRTMKRNKPHDELGNFQKPYQQTRADVLEQKYLKRPEYLPFDVKSIEPKKEDKTILEKFFNYYENAHPEFKKMNPYRKEFDSLVDEMLEDNTVDRKTFKMQLYKIYKAKKDSNEDVHPTRETNPTKES